MIKTDYMQKETFNRNFWEGFKALLGKGHVIKVGGHIAGTSAQDLALLVLGSDPACTCQHMHGATMVSGALEMPATHAALPILWRRGLSAVCLMLDRT